MKKLSTIYTALFLIAAHAIVGISVVACITDVKTETRLFWIALGFTSLSSIAGFCYAISRKQKENK